MDLMCICTLWSFPRNIIFYIFISDVSIIGIYVIYLTVFQSMFQPYHFPGRTIKKMCACLKLFNKRSLNSSLMKIKSYDVVLNVCAVHAQWNLRTMNPYDFEDLLLAVILLNHLYSLMSIAHRGWAWLNLIRKGAKVKCFIIYYKSSLSS